VPAAERRFGTGRFFACIDRIGHSLGKPEACSCMLRSFVPVNCAGLEISAAKMRP
jgi:hypothetical protein